MTERFSPRKRPTIAESGEDITPRRNRQNGVGEGFRVNRGVRKDIP